MRALIYVGEGEFELREKEKPGIVEAKDALVRVTLTSICSSDIHIMHGSVPMAEPGITVGHEFVGMDEAVEKDMINSLKICNMFG